MAAFKDHFSSQASLYARYRPHYPDELFAWLAGLSPARGLVWDCATGSGQAALSLSKHFDAVIATDASAAQLALATPAPRVTYRVLSAEKTDFAKHSFDLVTVAQALHWFDRDAFFTEVRRVLRPNGVFAAWSYELTEDQSAPEVNTVMLRYYNDVVGPYWPPERSHVMTAYREISFPFEMLDAPLFTMRASWSFEQLLGYFSSWSASQKYRTAHDSDPLDIVRADFSAAWGDPALNHEIAWPMQLKVGFVR